ncbi:MAG: hypothetical protein ACR2PG_08755 [Hyphomicrobiaceae bacterium]
MTKLRASGKFATPAIAHGSGSIAVRAMAKRTVTLNANPIAAAPKANYYLVRPVRKPDYWRLALFKHQ